MYDTNYIMWKCNFLTDLPVMPLIKARKFPIKEIITRYRFPYANIEWSHVTCLLPLYVPTAQQGQWLLGSLYTSKQILSRHDCIMAASMWWPPNGPLDRQFGDPFYVLRVDGLESGLLRWTLTDIGGTVFAPALPELLWLPTVWRCPYIEIAFSTLDCLIVPTCGAWCSATAAKRGPLKQSWAEIQHSRDDEPLGVLMQMPNVRVNGFFFFSSLGVLPGVLVDTLSLCSGDFCVECVLIVLHKFYIEL